MKLPDNCSPKDCKHCEEGNKNEILFFTRKKIKNYYEK